MSHLTNAAVVVPFSLNPVAPPRTGVVFVPCEICLAPVDLAEANETHGARLCEGHRVPDFAPLAYRAA
jgi:hypothetical protein